jgi:5-(carboxyamino)imidazole ribonucleotide synthase
MPRFQAVESPEDVRTVAYSFGYPLVLKARRDGYDGSATPRCGARMRHRRGLEKLSKGGRCVSSRHMWRSSANWR